MYADKRPSCAVKLVRHLIFFHQNESRALVSTRYSHPLTQVSYVNPTLHCITKEWKSEWHRVGYLEPVQVKVPLIKNKINPGVWPIWIRLCLFPNKGHAQYVQAENFTTAFPFRQLSKRVSSSAGKCINFQFCSWREFDNLRYNEPIIFLRKLNILIDVELSRIDCLPLNWTGCASIRCVHKLPFSVDLSCNSWTFNGPLTFLELTNNTINVIGVRQPSINTERFYGRQQVVFERNCL
mmetsp:Transcript_34853/g.103925  ORF Transcript_34853/g.103925 Transcript_34853/m.103925 type:complete len:238 (+) Transcript_34853:442-1155(+)